MAKINFEPEQKIDFQPEQSNVQFEPIAFEPEGKPSAGGLVQQFGIGFGNELLLGAPLYALKKAKGEEAVKSLESNVPIERIARGTGTVVGMAVGLPKVVFGLGVKGAGLAARAAMGAEKLSKVDRFAKSAVKAGAGVGAFELAHAPEESFKEKVITVPTAALFGAATGVAGEAIAPPVMKFLRNKGWLKDGFVGGTKELDTLNKILTPEEVAKESVQVKAKNFGNIIETQIVDKFAPIRHIQEAAEKVSGKPLQFSEKPYEAARLYGGVSGKIVNRFNQLSSILQPHQQYLKPIEQIFTAERLLERANRGIANPGQVTSEQAQKMLGDIEVSLGKEKYAQLKSVTTAIRKDFTDVGLGELVDAGVLDKAGLNRILAKNEFYAPFEVVEYVNKNADKIPLGAKAFQVGKSGFLHTLEGTEKGINSPLDALMRHTISTVELAEKNKVLQKVVNLRNTSKEMEALITPLGKSGKLANGFEKINVFEDGVKNSYAVPKELADTLKGLNSESIDMITKFASFSARALRVGATQMNLAFIVPNIIRDVQSAALVSKVGFSPLDWVKGFASAFRKDGLYKQFLEDGGSFGGYLSKFRRTIPGNINELVPSISNKVNQTLNPVKWINNIAEISEQSTRLGVFSRGLRAGLSGQEAAFNARNATIDFAKSGTKLQIANMWVPFLNARLQGTLNILNSAKSNPGRFALISSGMIGAPLTATYMWNTANFPDVWQDIAQFEKDNNFIFITGREKDEQGRWLNVHKIPKGDVGRILGNPLETFYEYLRGVDPDFSNIAMKVLDDVSPVGFSARTLSNVLPPFMKAAAEYQTNKNLFTGRDIVPLRLQKASSAEQYTDKTAPIAIQVGKLLNISPMKVETAIGTMFGGLGKQVLDPLSASGKISSRFSGAYGNEEQERQFDILEDIIRDTEDNQAKEFRLIRQSLQDFKTVPPYPEFRKNFIKNRFGSNTKAIEKFVELWQAGASGEQSIHRALKSATVKDRIRFIREYSQTLDSDEEKLLFLEELIKNKVITEESFKSLEK